jgi:hypothetical protein
MTDRPCCFGLWQDRVLWQWIHGKARCSLYGGDVNKREEEGGGPNICSSKYALLRDTPMTGSPIRLHLLKVSLFPTVLKAGDHAFITWGPGAQLPKPQ